MRPDQANDAQVALRAEEDSRIRGLRLAGALTQEALEVEVGLSRNMIVWLEWGRKCVAYECLLDVAGVLGVPARSSWA